MNEMSPWASRRKTIYLVVIVLVLSSVSFAIFWKYWYRTPTCFDNVKNGDEGGVDCGGSCSLICSSGVIKPIVRWDPRLFEVMPGVWSAIVYVENQNTSADAIYVPYTFTLYDENNEILVERKGATILPKNKIVGVFEGSISIENGVRPRRAVFELGSNIVWKKNEEAVEKLKITHSPLFKLDSAPRVEVSIKNNSIKEIKNIELIVAIFDGADNVIAASRTFVEKIKKDENTNVFFTWPKPFELGSKACEKSSDVMLLLDRSGSMASLGDNPPEPLSGAKKAAISFAEQLGVKDKIGFASFASKVKDPIDLTLSSDLNLAKQTIEGVSIETGSTQYTNIFEALHSAWQELISARGQNESSKIVILLTDGVANNPRDPQGRTEADDIKYAEGLATKEAVDIKNDGLVIYVIGLGNKINESFLKDIASETNNYFFAPTTANLETIYKNISSDICEEVPARIEITYKIFGDSI
ncbi:MAG: vWA domain-containing protein [Patescibacteria group bacterium]